LQQKVVAMPGDEFVTRHAAMTADESVSRDHDATLATVLARHLATQPEAPLLISPETGRALDYAALGRDVAALDAELGAQGIGAGAHVGFLLPNGIATSALFLATMIGGRVTVPLNLLSQPPQLAWVIAHSEVRALVVSAEHEAIARSAIALVAANDAAATPILLRVIDIDRPLTEQCMMPGGHRATPAPTASVTALLMYTSGTTGQPKGIVRDNGGSSVATQWTMQHFYTIQPGETMWAASDVGWQVGHSYIAYGPMLHGATATLYEGKPVGTPDAGAFWRVISQHRIPVLFTAPTAFRAIKREDPNGLLIRQYDLSHFRALFLAGERCDPDTLQWAEDHLKVPVIDHWWQTETGWAIAGIPLGVERMPVKYGSTSKPMPGWNVQVLGADRQPVATGQEGALVMKLPMPPGAFTTLWNAEKRCRSAYYEENPGFYTTGDAGFIDEDGYIFVMGRVDDVINVAGHRLSTGAMEEVLASHPDVAECAVIGVTDPMKGELPLGFIVLKSGVTRSDEEITQEVIALVRERIGPVAAFKTSVVVKRLPKTRSGKILRGTMHKIADSAEYKVPATIDDPAILGEIEEALQTVGYARKD